MVSLEEGICAVRVAREWIDAETNGRSAESKFPESFEKMNNGVFVSLNEHPSGILRGCIGYPQPPFDLARALTLSARGVCYDERFPRLRSTQVSRVTVEVTILTVPQKIEYQTIDELISQIEIGKDGLIVRYARNMGLVNSALYLPQVPVEEGWDHKTYLSHLCMKAGLQEDAWRSCSLEFQKFQGEIFSETSPCGEIVRR
ncbi:MAG: TIGR00296 family protein [archaeon]|nr:TIGR00296 family protein [archaeon]